MLFTQTNLLNAFGLLGHMDETPIYIMDSNDWLEFLDTMNNREIAKLARDLARNPTPTEPEMNEIYQLCVVFDIVRDRSGGETGT